MKQNQIISVVILTALSCSLLFVIEQVFDAHYLVKTGSKIVLFLIVPLLYIRFVLGERIWESLRFNQIDKPGLIYGAGLGILSMIIVVTAFFLLQDVLQPELIISDLRDRLGITFETYVYIAIYIVVVNSLLEEFYFRGFIFLKFYQSGYQWLGYLFSSGLFAVYHMAIFATWFDTGLTLLALAGLFVVGLVFCWLDTKSNNFLNSWILHICADIAVVAIGFYLFSTL
ncbi:CPBP family intramembrane metalloprotease [Filobacillus milosensis]|uniref:CPBP family intramembrane metalloprotease n=1 Tax=Filobacillus milosensis TaxID=94137 RepID=A0A4Y8IDV5_9BACI|nr:CPBP family intramembrane glutamic endopeptidase [Filobacillus milosensis]TFB14126.1 CPBP family intramembrane metalloprotease [Filobacillus milosensis]